MSGRWLPRNTTLHQKALHRAVYNDWGLYQFVQMLEYKCVLAGKTLEYVDERESSKRCSRCGHTPAHATVPADLSLPELWTGDGP